ncbi:MAG: hypothetical protein JJ863_23900 [Deltaproteobacteria bacterium]|nr:hypothetical protein [Deltaproteobacteria bacterium]
MRVWAWLMLVSSAGCASPVVGAECAAGYELCDGRCVDLSSDGAHCGACGNACVDGVCVDGVCPGGPLLDGGPDADVGDMGPRDGGRDRPDFGPPPACACNLGESCCDATCVDVDIEPGNCGACGNACADGEVCSAGSCGPDCDDGLTLCSGLCLDLSNDPNNCGSCGNVCATGICIDGECAIGFPGHVILVGHDYQSNREGQNRVAGNAIFTSFEATPQVVGYRGSATTASVRGVERAVDQVAAERARSWDLTTVEADEVTAALDDADVFLVFAQGDATADDALADLGALWSVALDTFTRRGGVVVVFDGPAMHSGTWQVLARAALLDVGGRVEVTGDELALADPSDTVAFGVPIRYVGERATVRFADTDGAQSVVAHPEGSVVLHRTVVP